jgi:hypothetical protein
VSELVRVAAAALQSFAASTAVLLALFLGVCVLFNFRKLKPRRGARVVRDLDERLGGAPAYFPPSVPRGPIDQLRTPELLEAQRRKSA